MTPNFDFFNKKEKPDYSVFLIGLIAIGIMISVAVGLMVLTQRLDVSSVFESKAVQKAAARIIAQPRTTPEQVMSEYKGTMDVLHNKVKMASNFDSALSEVEDVIFSIAVPKELMDRHFELVLAVDKLKGRVGSEDDGVLLGALVAEIERLKNED